MASMLPIYLSITILDVVTGTLFNAALYKPAYMSSVYPMYNWTAELATDGNDDTYIYHGHCVNSVADNPGWWMVDLRGLYVVEQIVLVNRGDEYTSSTRTKNFQFDIFETDPRLSRDFPMAQGTVCYTRVEPVGQGETLTQNCTAPTVGRFVRYIRYTTDAINFCEVKVMASRVIYRLNKFVVKKNYLAQVSPILSATTTSALACTLMCLQRRDSDTCTAVNWVRTTKLCQMLKVDPRSVTSLIPDSSTNFYIEA